MFIRPTFYWHALCV